VPVVGFVGLGNMGSVLAANLVSRGHDLVAHDRAGDGGSPDGATFVATLAEVARRADVVVCSLPDGEASESVTRAIARADGRRTAQVVETSTIGVAAARANDERLAAAGVGYVDAAVSGGVAGARARTLSVMYAAPPEVCDAVAPVLAGLSDRRRCVGAHPGMAQALKLANNFLSAIALAATSEAITFGVSAGLDIETMLEVLNVSSGQSQATSDKFPNHVVTGRFAAGFTNSLMRKDMDLYLRAAEELRAPSLLAGVTAEVWTRFCESEPDADFTRIYPFVSGS
jgi:3-hydroxyisobutyrate dehydrogenase-like beta-hydroxyacid dehydrogenase